MGKLVKTVFGGKDTSAQKGQIAANKEAQAYIRDMHGQARGDARALGSAQEANQNMGFQSALDVYGQTIPQQFSTFQQGNMGAQGALLAGMPQFQNAILGMPVDYSQFQPTQINYNTDFAQQQLPEFISSAQALGGMPAQGPVAPARGAPLAGWPNYRG